MPDWWRTSNSVRRSLLDQRPSVPNIAGNREGPTTSSVTVAISNSSVKEIPNTSGSYSAARVAAMLPV